MLKCANDITEQRKKDGILGLKLIGKEKLKEKKKKDSIVTKVTVMCGTSGV